MLSLFVCFHYACLPGCYSDPHWADPHPEATKLILCIQTFFFFMVHGRNIFFSCLLNWTFLQDRDEAPSLLCSQNHLGEIWRLPRSGCFLHAYWGLEKSFYSGCLAVLLPCSLILVSTTLHSPWCLLVDAAQYGNEQTSDSGFTLSGHKSTCSVTWVIKLRSLKVNACKTLRKVSDEWSIGVSHWHYCCLLLLLLIFIVCFIHRRILEVKWVRVVLASLRM